MKNSLHFLFLFVLVIWQACKNDSTKNMGVSDSENAVATPQKIEESDPTALQFKANLQNIEQIAQQAQTMKQSLLDIRQKLDAIPASKKSDPKVGFQQVNEMFVQLENEFRTATTELDSVRLLNQKVIENYQSGKVVGEDAMKQYSRVVVRMAKIKTTLEKSPDLFEDIRRFAERQ